MMKSQTQARQKNMPLAHKKTRGQALVEFSLILPILLLILLGIIDYGRILLIYANISSSIRDGARNAEILGVDSSGTPSYINCGRIDEDVKDVIGIVNLDAATINILYFDTSQGTGSLATIQSNIENAAADPTTADFDCDSNITVPNVSTAVSGDLNNGDLMVITLSVEVEFITPILSSMFPSLQLDFRAQRSIVTSLSLSELTTDRDFDGLDDDWETENFGCMWVNNEIEGTNYVVRGTGELVDPVTHDSLDPQRYGNKAADGSTVTGRIVFGQNVQNAVLTNRHEWMKKACELEIRIIGTADGEYDYTGIEYPNGWPLGCELYDSAANSILCPVPNTDEFNAADDPDGEGCSNGCEIANGTDPITGMTGSSSVDTDNDGLDDSQERIIGSEPLEWDTDGDGLSDGDEVNTHGSSPLLYDSDGDGLSDFIEVGLELVDPITGVTYILGTFDGDGDLIIGVMDEDSDNDGISDGDEHTVGTPIVLELNGVTTSFSIMTSPISWDTDGDGLDDWDEILGTTLGVVTDPTKADSDDDGVDDYTEFLNGSDNTAADYTNPISTDTDGDGLSDGDEQTLYGTYTNNTNSDAASEGCSGIDNGSHFIDDKLESIGPLIIDASNAPNAPFDVLNPDGDLLTNGMDDDSDGDTLSDCDEVYLYSTNPYLDDTDNDGVNDGDEVTCANLDPITYEADAVTIFSGGCDTTDSDTDGIPDLWEGSIGFGCTYAADISLVLRSNGDVVDPSNPVVSAINPANFTGIAYPSQCLAYSGSIPSSSYYLEVSGAAGGTNDPDSDGCDNTCEFSRRTDPWNPDTDGDGLLDGAEIGTSPRNPDTDGDGLNDGDEVNTYGTDPLDTDFDDDGLEDGDEVDITVGYNVATDPANHDSDGDGLWDGAEVGYGIVVGYGTNPALADTDSDDLSDYQEIFVFLTNPLNDDTDGDTLKDGDEVNIYGTDALDDDTDGDNLTDGQEVDGFTMTIELTTGTVTETIKGYNDLLTTIANWDTMTQAERDALGGTIPLLNDIRWLSPLRSDSDSDGWSDGYETHYQYYLLNPGSLLVPDITAANGTNPTLADTDGDGTSDRSDGEPLDAGDVGDSDGDGLTDVDETDIYGTDPNDPDTDGDGLGDKEEVYPDFTDGGGVDVNVEYYAYDSTNPTVGILTTITETINLNGLAGDDDCDDGIIDGYDSDCDGLSDSYELYMAAILLGAAPVSDGTYPALDACAYYTDPDPDIAIDPAASDGLHPYLYDTDGDGVGDGDECNVYLSDPLSAVVQADVILTKITNETFRDSIVYPALQHQYAFVTIVAGGYGYTIDSTGRVTIEVVRLGWDGTDFADITPVVEAACGSSATLDTNPATVHTNQCGVVLTQTVGDDVVIIKIAPSAIYDLIQSADIDLVRPYTP